MTCLEVVGMQGEVICLWFHFLQEMFGVFMCFGISDSSGLCPLQGIYVVHADPRAGWAVVSGSNRSLSLQVDKTQV